ncbi:MAG: sugar ABC transporter ATP-binding protein [Clostridia bacterium]|nr:sugar ABC transporter ATP-binding protein [Clostridia bacterium]
MAELFRMEGITKTFPGVKALDNVSFSVDEGEVHGLVGENGAGKSTLMKVMSGVYQADEGRIFIRDKEVRIRNVAEAQDLGVAIIMQEMNLCPELTIADNIFLGRAPKIAGMFINEKKMHAEAKKILDDLGIDLNTYTAVKNLTIAQQQMVEIAKSISHNAQILVLDEPTAALSEREIETLMDIIRNLQKRGVGMVYISHRLEELDMICQRVSVLRDGQYQGTRELKDLTMDELIKMIVGRALDDRYPKYKRTIGDVALEIDNLVGKGKKHVAVDHLEVRHGEILGVAGLMGAGRSEIFRAVYGADPSTKSLKLDGKPITVNSPAQANKAGIGFVTENRKLDGLALSLDVLFNINMAHTDAMTVGGFVKKKEEIKNAEEYIKALRIRTPSYYQVCRNLSGGNQQKVVVAKWLCNKVNVLIIDEPTRGIDVGSKFEIYELLNQLSDEGVAIIMISSELPEILGMSDRVIVIHEGEINGEMPTSEATQEKLLYLAAGYNKLENQHSA